MVAASRSNSYNDSLVMLMTPPPWAGRCRKLETPFTHPPFHDKARFTPYIIDRGYMHRPCLTLTCSCCRRSFKMSGRSPLIVAIAVQSFHPYFTRFRPLVQRRWAQVSGIGLAFHNGKKIFQPIRLLLPETTHILVRSMLVGTCWAQGKVEPAHR